MLNKAVLAAAGAGLLAGIVGSVVANAWLNNGRPPQQTVTYVPTVGPKENASAREALSALALASASRPQPAISPPPPTAAQPLPRGTDPEMQEFQDWVAKHAREPESTAWAARVKQGLSADLEKLSAVAQFSRFELTCRSETCVGVIEWPSPLAAHQHMRDLLHNQYTINSAVRFGLPDRAGDGPYRVGVIFVPAPGT